MSDATIEAKRKIEYYENVVGHPIAEATLLRSLVAEITTLQEQLTTLQDKLDTCLKWDDIESARNEKLQSELASAERVIDAARNLYSHEADIPESYDNENDDVGRCVHCQEWNSNHSSRCEGMALVKALSTHKANKEG